MRRTRNKLAASAKIVTPILPRLPSLPQPHPPHHRAAGFLNNKRFRYNANGNLSRKLSEKDRHGQALSHRARRRQSRLPAKYLGGLLFAPQKNKPMRPRKPRGKSFFEETRSFSFSEKLSAFCEFLYYRTIPSLWINHKWRQSRPQNRLTIPVIEHIHISTTRLILFYMK